MNIKKTILPGLATMGMMLGMVFGPTNVAHALPTCISGRLCIWDGTNYSGSTLSMTIPAGAGCKNIPYDWAKNMMTSFYNNSNHNLTVYDDDNCTAIIYVLYAHEADPSITDLPSVNNKMNSFGYN